jgi:hypothetical protein
MQAQVPNLSRKSAAIGREVMDLGVSAAGKPRATAAVVVIRTFRHSYKIVGCAGMLEDGIKVTQS